MAIHAFFGILAGIVALGVYPVYIADILRGHTKPSRVTWWVLTLSNGILTASYFSSGARDTIWIPVSYTVGFLVAALLSLKYGEERWSTTDTVSIVGVIISVLIWLVFHSPGLALLVIISVECFGLMPTFTKSYYRPWTENKLAWQIATFASFLNIFAIETWTVAVAFYPFYVFLTNGLIAYFLMFPRFQKEPA